MSRKQQSLKKKINKTLKENIKKDNQKFKKIYFVNSLNLFTLLNLRHHGTAVTLLHPCICPLIPC